MSKREKPIETAKKTDGDPLLKNQNQLHNSKKAALGPNAKR